MPGAVQVATYHALQHDDDRVSARDKMIVGKTEVEFRAVVDGEKTERLDATLGCEARVELALDLAAQCRNGFARAWNHAQGQACRAARPLVALLSRVKLEPGESEVLELFAQGRLETDRIDRMGHAYDVHRVVGMQR